MGNRARALNVAIILFAILAIAVVADFVQTVVIFTVDTSLAFTVFTLGSSGVVGTNQTNSKTTLVGNYTETYFFNTTNAYAELVRPCGSADGSSNCQNGMNIPAYRIRNTGNVNITITMNLSTAPTNIKLCANSTAPGGCTGTTVATCDISGTKGNLNNSAWLNITSNLGTSSTCHTNVTIYANFTGVTINSPQTSTITLNSTAS